MKVVEVAFEKRLFLKAEISDFFYNNKEGKMKRFWLVLLSLGLVMAFSVSAFAVDVKVGAEYYAAGMYLNKTSLYDGPSTLLAYKWEKAKKGDDPLTGKWKRDDKNDVTLNEAGSTAFFFQRLRVGTDFIVSPSLKLVTRFDAMERIWGGARGESAASSAAGYDTLSAGTKAENQNIAFDLMYINYESPIGLFKVGYQIDSAWGTIFMDSSMPRGTVAWSYTNGPWWFYLGYKVWDDRSLSAVTTPAPIQTDLDRDKSALAFKYIGKDAEGGVLGGHVRDARSKTAITNTTYLLYYLQPYAKAKFGPVSVQAEVDYFWGDYPKDATPASLNQKMELLAGWVDATANFGMFYAGGTVAYVSGDDPSTTDKIEGNSLVVNGGIDWNPCLLMFNNDVTYWVGNVSANGANINGPMANAWFFQGRAGVRPTPELDVMLSVSYAMVDKKPSGFTNGGYGTEVDLVGTYKITNNLSYMLGAGYLFAGDLFKGTGVASSIVTNPNDVPAGVTPPNSGLTEIQNNFILMNKLILTF